MPTTLDIDVYTNGLCCCSACVPKDATADQIEDAVNAVNPTGTDSRWRISKDAFFKGGEPNPGPCNHDPEGRRHVLLEC